MEISNNKKVKSVNKPHVIIGKGQVPLDEYIEENHEEFEKALIGYMHEKDHSLEEVLHELINGRSLKTDIVFKDHGHKLLDTKWASIDVPTAANKDYYQKMNKHK